MDDGESKMDNSVNPEDDLTQDDTPGNVWEEAMSRRRDEWDDDE